MVLPTVTTDQVTISLVEAITGWVGGVLSAGTNRQGTNCIAITLETGAGNFTYTPVSAINLTNKGVIFWYQSVVSMDTKANGGIKLQLNSVGASSTWNVAGSDTIPSQGWTPFCVDVTTTPDVTTGGGVNIALVTSLVFTYTSVNVIDVVEPNTFLDAVRSGTKISIKGGGELAWDTGVGTLPVVGQTVTNGTQTGTGIIVKVTGTIAAGTMVIRAKTGAFADNDSISTPTLTSAAVNSLTGTALGVPATFQDILDAESLSANQYGIAYVWDQIMLTQGIIEIGSTTSGEVTVFKDDSRIVKFRDDSIIADGFSKFTVVGETYCELGDETGTAPASVGSKGGTLSAKTNNFSVVASDANIKKLDLLGLVIDGANLLTLTNTNIRLISCTIQNSGKITLSSGAELRDSVVTNTTELATSAAIELNSAPTDPEFRDMLIQNNLRGVEISTAGTYDFRNIKFAGNTFDVLLNHTTGLVTINVLEGGDTPTVENTGAGTYDIVTAQVTLSFNVKNSVDPPVAVQNARALAWVTDSTNYFYQASVTITSVTTTATVTHTAHGITTGEYVWINGANEDAYNGQFQITVTGVNTYTYTMQASASSPATGTILSTFVIISGLTDINGDISDTRSWTANQAFKGRVAKSTTAPFYKRFPFQGIINNATGFSQNIQLLDDF